MFHDNRAADVAAVDTAATTAAALSVSVGKAVELNLNGLAPEAVSLVKESSQNIEAALVNSWMQAFDEEERSSDSLFELNRDKESRRSLLENNALPLEHNNSLWLC